MRKLFSLYLIPFALYLLVLASCYTPRYMYSPAAQNIPVLKQKGDSKIAAGIASNASNNNYNSNIFSGYDIQGAYAFSNHLALQVNQSHRKEKNGGNFDISYRDSVVIRYLRNLTEIGIGYYNTPQDKPGAAFQVFAGIGFGKFSFTDNGRDPSFTYYSRFHQASVTRYFLQPAFMINTRKNFTAALSSRFNIISFHGIKTDYNAVELDNYKLDSLAYSPHVFWEPAIVNSFGFKQIPGFRFECQAAFCFLASRRFIDYRTLGISVAAMADLRQVLKAKARTSKKRR